MPIRPIPCLIAAALLLTACKEGAKPEGDASPSGPSAGAAATGQGTVDSEASWRQPDVLIGVMPMVAGKTVADLFAGDGYYSFALVNAGARVIAVVADAAQADALKERAKARGIGADKLEVRVAADGIGLAPGEADMAFSAHPYLRLPDRINYLKRVRGLLKSPAPVVLVDFVPRETPVGQPLAERISEQAVMDEMEQVGYTDIGAYGKKLPYQWVLIALDFVPDPDEATATP